MTTRRGQLVNFFSAMQKKLKQAKQRISKNKKELSKKSAGTADVANRTPVEPERQGDDRKREKLPKKRGAARFEQMYSDPRFLQIDKRTQVVDSRFSQMLDPEFVMLRMCVLLLRIEGANTLSHSRVLHRGCKKRSRFEARTIFER